MKKYDLIDWMRRAYERTGGRGAELAFMFNPDANDMIDIHTHTTYSDGVKSVPDMASEAESEGVSVYSVTDHDTIKGEIQLVMGEEDLADYTGEFVNGVEITSRLGKRRIEILIYGYDIERASYLIENYDFPYLNRKFKIKRNIYNLQKRIDTVNRLGLTDKKLSLSDFLSIDVKGRRGEPTTKTFSELGIDANQYWNFDTIESTLSKKDIPQTIKYNGKEYPVNFDYFNSKLFKFIVQTEQGREYLSKYQNKDGQPVTNFPDFNRHVLQIDSGDFSVDDEKLWPSVKECCEFARKTGGVAFLAHPYGYGPEQGLPEAIIADSIKAGIDGIEVMHGFNSAIEVEQLYNCCYEFGLLISMGSDSHGYQKTREGRNYRLGHAPGKNDKLGRANYIYELPLTLQNLHYIGMGKYKNKKSASSENQQGYGL